MGSTFAVLVDSASFVLVVTAIMIAASISAPSSNTVNRLTAATRDARFVVVAVWAALAIVSSTCAILVVSAPPVLMILGKVSTRTIRAPSSNAVHRLTALSLSLSLSVSLSLSTVLPLKKNKKRKKKETVSDIFKEDSRTKRRCVHDQGHRNRDEVEELRSVGLGCFRVHDSNVPEDES